MSKPTEQNPVIFRLGVSLLYSGTEAQLIKTQREKLGFNLKIQKAKQPATGSYLDLNPKMVILPPGISE